MPQPKCQLDFDIAPPEELPYQRRSSYHLLTLKQEKDLLITSAAGSADAGKLKLLRSRKQNTPHICLVPSNTPHHNSETPIPSRLILMQPTLIPPSLALLQKATQGSKISILARS